MSAQRGILIAFEGIDGAGKTTQLGRLARRLQAQGREVVCSREPTAGGPSESGVLKGACVMVDLIVKMNKSSIYRNCSSIHSIPFSHVHRQSYP